MSSTRTVRPVTGSNLDVAQAQQQQQLAQALYAKSLQGNPVPTGGPVQAKYGVGNALVDLAGVLAGSYGLKQANDQVAGAKRAESTHLADAISQYRNSVPDQAVGAASRIAMNGPMEADGLPQSVTPRSEATSNLAAATGPDAQRGLALALMQQGMSQPETKYQDLGDRIAIIRDGQIVGSMPKGATPDARLSGSITLRGQGLTAETAANGQAVTMRGQDSAAATARRGQDIAAATASATRAPGGKPLTEFQTKAIGQLTRMEGAEQQLDSKKYLPSLMAQGAASVPGVGNYLTSPEYQEYEQAAKEWISGLLRLDSGAAVPETEFKRYFQTYFPQPGNTDAVVAQKKASRDRASAALRTSLSDVGDRLPQQPAPLPTGGPAQIKSDAEFDALPSGAEFIAPDGSHRRKP